MFSGGQFPTTYQITINFGDLLASNGIPTNRVRKLRSTWAADMQLGEYQREFQVIVSNWSVSGSNCQYSVAGPGSRRIEDTDTAVNYGGTWTLSSGNYSGTKIHSTTQLNATCIISYSETTQHQLYLGTRLLAGGATVNVSIDGQALTPLNLLLSGEDVLTRSPLGTYGAGTHTIVLTHAGPDENSSISIFSKSLTRRPTCLTMRRRPSLHWQPIGIPTTLNHSPRNAQHG